MEAAYQTGQTAVFACGRNTSWRYHHIVRWPSISRGDGKGNIETGRTLTWKKIQLRRRGQSREHCVHKKESINILHNYILLTTVRTYTVTHNSVLMFVSCIPHVSRPSLATNYTTHLCTVYLSILTRPRSSTATQRHMITFSTSLWCHEGWAILIYRYIITADHAHFFACMYRTAIVV